MIYIQNSYAEATLSLPNLVSHNYNNKFSDTTYVVKTHDLYERVFGWFVVLTHTYLMR